MTIWMTLCEKRFSSTQNAFLRSVLVILMRVDVNSKSEVLLRTSVIMSRSKKRHEYFRRNFTTAGGRFVRLIHINVNHLK